MSYERLDFTTVLEIVVDEMKKNNVGNRIISLLLCILLVGIVLIPGNVQADWGTQATLDSSPSSAYIGTTTTFEYTLSNTGTTSFDTSTIEIIFDWMTSGLSYQPTPQVVGVPPGGSHVIEVTILVPDVTTGAHTATVKINAKGG